MVSNLACTLSISCEHGLAKLADIDVASTTATQATSDRRMLMIPNDVVCPGIGNLGVAAGQFKRSTAFGNASLIQSKDLVGPRTRMISCASLPSGEGTAMAETRKLAAILAADVVGYSKLAGPMRSGRWRGCVRSAAI